MLPSPGSRSSSVISNGIARVSRADRGRVRPRRECSCAFPLGMPASASYARTSRSGQRNGEQVAQPNSGRRSVAARRRRIPAGVRASARPLRAHTVSVATHSASISAGHRRAIALAARANGGVPAGAGLPGHQLEPRCTGAVVVHGPSAIAASVRPPRLRCRPSSRAGGRSIGELREVLPSFERSATGPSGRAAGRSWCTGASIA